MFDNSVVLCEECGILNQKSFVYILNINSQPVEIYFDQDGNFHNHKNGNSVYHLVCDKNHTFTYTRPNKGCSVRNCLWNFTKN